MGYLNDSCDLDRIEEDYKKKKNMLHHCFKKIGWKILLYIDKLTLHHFTCYIVMRHEQEGE